MCRKITPRRTRRALAILLAASAALTAADWRRIGNSAVDLALAGPATGPVDRVWYSPDGATLYARTRSGGLFSTTDFERWRPAPPVALPAPSTEPAGLNLPETGALVRPATLQPGRLYAGKRFVYRSDDGGQSWSNLTQYRQDSIIGGGVADIAVSPVNPEEVVVANQAGVWRTADGGSCWFGLNQDLPNLPVRAFAALPVGTRGIRILTGLDPASAPQVVEWSPGERRAWRMVSDPVQQAQGAVRAAVSHLHQTPISALEIYGDYLYAASADGRIWASSDQGRDWIARPGDGFRVSMFWVDDREPRRALAVVEAPVGSAAPRVLRTINGGLVWEDLSSNLNSPVHGVTADRTSNTVYAATARGVFAARVDLVSAAPPAPWTRVEGLPEAPARDVRLDAGGNQLYVAVDGYGIFAATAPHRSAQPRAVNAADLSARPAAPGSLVSILGARVQAARSGELTVPVLAATENESQIQVPFEVRGNVLPLGLEISGSTVAFRLPIEPVSPAIFVDRDGTPMLLEGDSGVLLDAMTPARSGTRLQILMTGLGPVQPEWPTGLAAPLEDAPKVSAPLRVFLDRVPLEIGRATLAPGYVGFYLVEARLPDLVNAGPAELFVEAAGRESNRVRLYVEP